jgi:hypothetical protein
MDGVHRHIFSVRIILSFWYLQKQHVMIEATPYDVFGIFTLHHNFVNGGFTSITCHVAGGFASITFLHLLWGYSPYITFIMGVFEH